MHFRASPEVQWALLREQDRSGRSLSEIIREAILIALARPVFATLEQPIELPDFDIDVPEITVDVPDFDVDLSDFDLPRPVA